MHLEWNIQRWGKQGLSMPVEIQRAVNHTLIFEDPLMMRAWRVVLGDRFSSRAMKLIKESNNGPYVRYRMPKLDPNRLP